MVSTRSHPSAFPPPDLASPTKSPSKRRGGSRAASTASPAPAPAPAPGIANAATTAPTSAPTSAPSTSTAHNDAAATTTAKRSDSTPASWTHTPSRLTLAWLALTVPLVAWDTGYMLLRPHSMPGGALHWPLWQPYALYGTVDHVYGFPAWTRGDGFGAAQASLNLVETVMYVVYLGIVYRSGSSSSSSRRVAKDEEEGAGDKGGAAARVVVGRAAAQAVLVMFAASVMTLSKTVLYFLNESWSGFENVGHNDAASLLFLWIIPNGAWLIFPTYMVYVFGSEIVQGLEAAGAAAAPSIKKSQ